ncbi:general substrate transporter [Xylariales sp. PMI_506]|nr:general substrate transporter [Xylariales sp. PMI_506]
MWNYQWPFRGKKLIQTLNYANSFAFMLYGWDAGVISGVLANPYFLEAMGNPTDSRYSSFIGSGILLGDVVGLAFLAPLSWRLGRRYTVILCCWIAIIGVILQAAAYSPIQVLVGRVILGIANGPLAATTPIYLQEANVTGSRRTTDTMVMVLWGIGGISAATWFDYAMLKAPDHNSWRVSLAMQAFFLTISLVLVYGCPDSPRWLLARGRESESDDAIKRLIDCNETDERFIKVKGDIMTSIKLEREQTKHLSWKALFTGDGSPTKNIQRIWLAIFINLANPFFGTQLITFYGQSLLEGVGIEGDQVTLALAAINTGIPIGMAISFVILPRVGRRPMLCWGATALTVLMCIYTGLANVENPSKGVQWGSVVILILFNLVNGCSWIWLAFLYAVEILPLQYRSQVQSGSNLVFWFIAFLAVYFGGEAASEANVGALIYIWFCLGGGIVTVLSWMFVVETKDLTLEEIDLLWADESYKNAHNEIQTVPNSNLESKEGSTSAELEV